MNERNKYLSATFTIKNVLAKQMMALKFFLRSMPTVVNWKQLRTPCAEFLSRVDTITSDFFNKNRYGS